MPNDYLVVSVYCQYSCCQWGGFCVTLVFFILQLLQGGSLGWVKSWDVELSRWLQAILFHARGGYRSGEELQGVTSSPALSLHPPRACWGLVECARLELSSWPFSYTQLVLIHTQQCFSCTRALVVLLIMVDDKNFTQVVIYSDIHCYWLMF